MPHAPTFDHFDEQLAAAMLTASGQLGGLPSYLGIRTTIVNAGTMSAEIDVRKELLNPFGSLHGGVVSALVDHVLGAVLYPVIERGRWAATTEFKLNLLAAVRSGRVVAESTIIAFTRRTAVVHVDVINDGRPCAVALGTVLITEPRNPIGPTNAADGTSPAEGAS